MFFYERGYTIVQKDEDLKFIATGEKAIKSSSIKIRAIIKDSTITFTGLVASDVTFSMGGAKGERTFYEAYYGGMKGGDLRRAWVELEEIAKQFGTLVYSK